MNAALPLPRLELWPRREPARRAKDAPGPRLSNVIDTDTYEVIEAMSRVCDSWLASTEPDPALAGPEQVRAIVGADGRWLQQQLDDRSVRPQDPMAAALRIADALLSSP